MKGSSVVATVRGGLVSVMVALVLACGGAGSSELELEVSGHITTKLNGSKVAKLQIRAPKGTSVRVEVPGKPSDQWPKTMVGASGEVELPVYLEDESVTSVTLHVTGAKRGGLTAETDVTVHEKLELKVDGLGTIRVPSSDGTIVLSGGGASYGKLPVGAKLQVGSAVTEVGESGGGVLALEGMDAIVEKIPLSAITSYDELEPITYADPVVLMQGEQRVEAPLVMPPHMQRSALESRLRRAASEGGLGDLGPDERTGAIVVALGSDRLTADNARLVGEPKSLAGLDAIAAVDYRGRDMSPCGPYVNEKGKRKKVPRKAYDLTVRVLDARTAQERARKSFDAKAGRCPKSFEFRAPTLSYTPSQAEIDRWVAGQIH